MPNFICTTCGTHFAETDQPASTVRRIVAAVEPFEFDRIYGAWWGKTVFSDAKAAVRRSAERYIRAVEST